MSDPPHQPAPSARPDGLIETGNPAVDPFAPGARPASDLSTVTNARSPTVPNTDYVPAIAGYVIVEKIGEGGMGAVFAARDEKLGRKVAIKTMKPELAAVALNRTRFLREAAAAAAIEHDNIVPIWHIGESADGTPFIAMPFLRGQSLHDRLAAEPVVPIDLILKVAGEVAAGLAAAHAAGRIHRDIKPGNVWLESDEQTGQRVRRCKILDFGLARSVDGNDAHCTASGAILGTPAYMAPEQARGEKVDHRADLFSLGVMLYRMSTGQQPFKGDTAMSVLIALATETPAPVGSLASDLPPELTDLIGRLMCKEPSGRPQSASAVVAEVAAISRRLAEREPEFVSRPRGPGSGSVAVVPDAPSRLFGTETVTAPLILQPQVGHRRAELTALTGVAALVPLVTAVCVAGWLAVQPSAPWTALARAFVLATVLAWAVALVGLIPARNGWRRWVRYACQLAVGAGVGVLALWCDGWALSAESADGRDLALPNGWRIGRDTAVVGLQYVIYFGLAVCACRWWWDRLRTLFRSRASGSEEMVPRGAGWEWALAPILLIAMLLAWPNRFAPTGLAVLILVAAFAAQAVRPLARVTPGESR
jgi:serine/threonine protein kinase